MLRPCSSLSTVTLSTQSGSAGKRNSVNDSDLYTLYCMCNFQCLLSEPIYESKALNSISIIYIAIIVILNMPPLRYAFHCIPTCSRGFNSPRGLSLHQATCLLFREERSQRMHALAQASEAEDAYIAMPFIAPPADIVSQ